MKRPTEEQRQALGKWIWFVGSLPREKFDFAIWGEDRNPKFLLDEDDGYPVAQPTFRRCTTVGCAGGWLPTVFPESFIWGGPRSPRAKGGGPRMRRRVGQEPWEAVSAFFGLDEEVAGSLVHPHAIFAISRTTRDGSTAFVRHVEGIDSLVTPKEWAEEAARIVRSVGITIPRVARPARARKAK